VTILHSITLGLEDGSKTIACMHTKDHISGNLQHSDVLYWCRMQELVNSGALVSIENKFGETPLDRSEASVAQILQGNLFWEKLFVTGIIVLV